MAENLNKRQLDIISDLETSNVYITAASLSKKYDVSLRTIRNDIENIAYALRGYDCTFERIPKIGMKITSRESLVKKLSSNDSLADYVIFSNDVKHMLLIMLALSRNSQYVTLQELSDLFFVSKTTISKDIGTVDNELKNYYLSLRGRKNKGFRIIGKLEDKVRLLDHIFSLKEFRHYYGLLADEDSVIGEADDLAEELIRRLHDERNLEIKQPQLLKMWLTYLMLLAAEQPELEETEIVGYINSFLHEKGMERYVSSDLTYKILYSCTDFKNAVRDNGATDRALNEAVAEMVRKIIYFCPQLEMDRDLLVYDLVQHFRNTIDRRNHNYDVENPMLDEIRNRNIEVYSLARNVSKTLEESELHYQITEDDVGYIALYLMAYLDRYQSVNEARIMVVCNTGAGAAKLLSNRLMNAFPEIHITMIKSYYDFNDDTSFLDNIDLIVSTVDLPEVSKVPYLVVSPFLTSKELIKIREVIWIINKSRQDRGNDESVAMTDYFDTQNRRITEGSRGKRLVSSDNYIAGVSPEKMAEVVLETFGLVTEVYPERITSDRYMIIQGLLAHVTMSVERWLDGKFLKPFDFDDMKESHEYEYSLTIEYLKRLEKILGIYIDPAEAIAIIRYFTL